MSEFTYEPTYEQRTAKLDIAQQIHNYNYWKMPQFLHKEPYQSRLSIHAKYLYVLLYNRMEESIRNGYTDEVGNIIIRYSRQQASEMLGCSYGKVLTVFKELEEVELIEDYRKGMNESNVIYVKAPIVLPNKDAENAFLQEVGQKNVPSDMPKTNIRRCRKRISGGTKNEYPEVRELDLRKKESRKIEVRKIEDTLSKDKGVGKQPLSVPNLIKEVFGTKEGLFSKKIDLGRVARELEATDGNKDVRKKAELKICLAKLLGDWSKVTGRDLGYWYFYHTYPDILGKACRGSVSVDARVLKRIVDANKGVSPEVIFYSMQYWVKLYPEFVKAQNFLDPTLENLSLKQKFLGDMFQQSFENSRRFISRGFTDKDKRSTLTTLNTREKAQAMSEEGSEDLSDYETF